MSELPDGMLQATPPSPRDSASGIVVRRGDQGWEVLLGLRSRRARFMPAHLAFPGGGVETEDLDGPGDPFATCVARELREESGLEIAPGRWVAAGERTTPPMFPVRFFTRFFVAALDPAIDPATLAPTTPENEELQFETASAFVERWNAGAVKVPPPVLPLLRALSSDRTATVAALAHNLTAVNQVEHDAPRIEFLPDVWVLPLRTATLPPATHTNVWMPGGRSFAVVDPGTGDADENDRLLRVIARRRELGSFPSAVLLTHFHRDHVGGARHVADALGLPLMAQRQTLERLELGSSPIECRELAEGDRLDLDGLQLVVHETPGHAPGHLAFEIPGRALISGDLVSGMSTILIDPDHGEMQAYLDSLERMAELDVPVLLPGHGPPLPASRLRAVIEHRLAREARIVATLARGRVQTLVAVAEEAYADTPQAPAALARRQTLSHLLRLEQVGRVARVGESWREGVDASGAKAPVCGAAQAVERRLTERLAPLHLRLRDDSAKHAGHAGASSGGGHFKLTLVSEAFVGRSRLEQHRLVYEALSGMFGSEIHALAIESLTPEEWRRRG